MRTLLRWAAATVALIAGLVLGAGTASASTPSASTHHVAAHTSTIGGIHPNDWWW